MKRWRDARARLLAGVSAICAAALFGVASADGGYQISNPTIATAGGTVANGCFALSSTIGEPVTGAIANDTYTLTSGFQATNTGGLSADLVFKNGFESQPKDCTP